MIAFKGVIASNINQTYDACPDCMTAFQDLLEERKGDRKDDT